VRSADDTISCRLIAPTLALVALLALPAAAQDVAPKPAPPTPTSAVAWSVALPAPPMYPPVMIGDRIFVALLPGMVAAYAADDGRELWRADLRPDAPIAVDEERVFVSAGEAIHALSTRDGTVLWRTPSGKVTVRPVAREGWVVVSSEGTLRALRAADGSEVWTQGVKYVQQPPAILGNWLIAGTADGFIRSHDLRTGAELWTQRIGGVPAEPLVFADRVYVGASDKRFYCLDALTGEFEWAPIRVGASMPMAAVADADRVYLVAVDNLVRAYDLRTGALKWQKGVPYRPFDGPVLAAGSVVLAGPVPDVRRMQPANGDPLPPLTFPDQLAAAAAIADAPDGLRVVGLTGSLEDTWKLTLVTPRVPESQSPKVPKSPGPEVPSPEVPSPQSPVPVK
jgi:outer membrane protein assembly factor BamB